MKEITKDQLCERAGDLVGFLYGELTDWEARKFERHMQDCAACKTEYAAFGQLRQSIVAWRDEALGLGGERLLAHTVPIQQRRPSALGALREFFNLSPLWLKGVAAFASVLFCVFATLAVAHLIEKPKRPIVQGADAKVYSPSEFEAQVNQLVQKKMEELKVNQIRGANNSGVTPSSVPKVVKRHPTGASSESASNSQRLRRPLSRQERQELAADLRLLGSRDENDLDLGSDINNQSPPW
jgi:hypothetical protein